MCHPYYFPCREQRIYGQNETGEVYLYSFSRTADGDPMLANIEDDEEYDAAANAFNAVVEKARADEEADAPLS